MKPSPQLKPPEKAGVVSVRPSFDIEGVGKERFFSFLCGEETTSDFGPFEVYVICSLRVPKTWICDSSVLGKKQTNILPNGGLMVIYHGNFVKNQRI